jgi:protein-tyrosine-phosphatase
MNSVPHPSVYRNIAIDMKCALFLLPLWAILSCEPAPQTAGRNSPNANENNSTSMIMLPALQAYADSLPFEFEQIPEERRNALKQLAGFIRMQKDSGHPVKLTFICTHNSRRSHMGQIWAAAAAAYYGIEGIETYSGGTEATAFNPRAVAAMERAGFAIDSTGEGNPRYRVHLNPNDAGLLCFSKKYDDAANPQKDFAAIMTCSQADAECPFIPGAKFRLALPYNDPKEADGTPEETARYDERCRQIGREVMYAFSIL